MGREQDTGNSGSRGGGGVHREDEMPFGERLSIGERRPSRKTRNGREGSRRRTHARHTHMPIPFLIPFYDLLEETGQDGTRQW
jgi:hypothetical protein